MGIGAYDRHVVRLHPRRERELGVIVGRATGEDVAGRKSDREYHENCEIPEHQGSPYFDSNDHSHR